MIGYESPYLDVECMTMAVTLVEALGLKGVKLHINTLGDEQSREAYRNALKEHFAPYLDELCSAFDTERSELEKKLQAVGYTYDREKNQFR